LFKQVFICLIGVSKATHTRHNAKYVVVDSEDLAATRVGTGYGSVKSHVKISGINTGEVETARWLMLFRLEGKRVYVNTRGLGGDVFVVLVRLYKTEIISITNEETILAIELNVTRYKRNTSLNTRYISCSNSKGIVGPVITGTSLSNTILVHWVYPYKFLDWVIEVHLNTSRGTVNDFIAGELELFNEVFMTELSKSATFISVKVYIVYPE